MRKSFDAAAGTVRMGLSLVAISPEEYDRLQQLQPEVRCRVASRVQCDMQHGIA